MRITEDLLLAYDRSLAEVARHNLIEGHSGQRRIDPANVPPRDHEEQMQRLQERFAELGEVGVKYLVGLERKQRNSKHQALRVLELVHAYHKHDLLHAMQRAVNYYAHGFASLERILAHQVTSKPGWQPLDEGSQETLVRLSSSEPIGSRHSQEYQHLLDGFSPTEGNLDHETKRAHSDETDNHANDRTDAPPVDPGTSPDAEDSAQ